MWHIRKIDPFDSLVRGRFITFVGAGGKTSLSEHLAAEGVRRGKRVALTTTTKIWVKEPYVTTDRAGWCHSAERLIHVGKTVEGSKLTGLSTDEVAAMGEHFDLVLIEADGAKGMPLKYPADHEPIIPEFSDGLVVVAGLDGLADRVDEKVFRWKLFSESTGFSGDDRVSREVLLRLFEKDGMMKGVDTEKCTIFLNKYDACTERRDVLALSQALSEQSRGAPVIIGSIRLGFFYGLHRESP
jgi:probable selenium-dependent hydroxylase accessory protein YqeC